MKVKKFIQALNFIGWTVNEQDPSNHFVYNPLGNRTSIILSSVKEDYGDLYLKLDLMGSDSKMWGVGGQGCFKLPLASLDFKLESNAVMLHLKGDPTGEKMVYSFYNFSYGKGEILRENLRILHYSYLEGEQK